jgi:hypothetical protein
MQHTYSTLIIISLHHLLSIHAFIAGAQYPPQFLPPTPPPQFGGQQPFQPPPLAPPTLAGQLAAPGVQGNGAQYGAPSDAAPPPTTAEAAAAAPSAPADVSLVWINEDFSMVSNALIIVVSSAFFGFTCVMENATLQILIMN